MSSFGRHRTHRDRDPDRELRIIQHRFRAVRRRHDRAKWLHDVARSAVLPAVVGIVVFVSVFVALGYSPFSAWDTVRHLLAYGSCDDARAVGLAPAYRGQPGYWAHQDADSDGIACEPWARR